MRPPVRPVVAGLFAALISALAVALFLRAHGVSRVAWFTVPIALGAGVSAGLFVRNGLRSVRRLDLLAIIVGAACVASILPPVARHFPSVSIMATGQKNAASAGSEIWVRLEPGAHGASGHWSGPADTWEARGPGYVSYRNQPGTLVWDGAWGDGATLVLTHHGWSGIARVAIGDKEETLDLYSAVAGETTVALPKPSLSWKDKMLWAMFALSLMLAFSLFAHFLRTLPTAWACSLAVALLAGCVTLYVLRDSSHAGPLEAVAFDADVPITKISLDAGHGFVPELDAPVEPSQPTRVDVAASPGSRWSLIAENAALLSIPLAEADGDGATRSAHGGLAELTAQVTSDRVKPIVAGHSTLYELIASGAPALFVTDASGHRHTVAVPTTGSNHVFVLVTRDETGVRVSVSRSFVTLPDGVAFSWHIVGVKMQGDTGHGAHSIFRVSFGAPLRAYALPSAGGDAFRVVPVERTATRMDLAIRLFSAAAASFIVLLIALAFGVAKRLFGLARSGRSLAVVLGTVGIVGWMALAALITWPAVVGWDGTMPYTAYGAGYYDTWYGVGYPLLMGALLLLQGPQLVTAIGVAGTTVLLLTALAAGLDSRNRSARALLVVLCLGWLPLSIIPFASAIQLRDAMNGPVMAAFAIGVYWMLRSWNAWAPAQRCVGVAWLIVNGAVAVLLRIDNLPTLVILFAGACFLCSGRRLPRLGMLAAALAVWFAITPLMERALFPDRAALAAEKRLYGTTALINPVTGMLKFGQDSLPPDTAAHTRTVLDRLIDVDYGLAHWSPYNIVYWHQTASKRPPPTDAALKDLRGTFLRLALHNPALFVKLRLATLASNLGYGGAVGGMQMNAADFEGQSFYDHLVDPHGPIPKFRWLYGFFPSNHLWPQAAMALRHWTATIATHLPQLALCLIALACFRRYPPCALIAAGTVARVGVFFLFAPASVFLYLYDLQLIGFCLPFLMAGWRGESVSRPARPSGVA